MLNKGSRLAKNGMETDLSPAEFNLLRMLADAEDDVKNERIKPAENVFEDLRTELQNRRKHQNML